MIRPLPVGAFLSAAFGLVGVILALEVWLFYQRRHITISELAHRTGYLRWLIESAFLLGGAWWAIHSGTLR